MEVSEFMRKNVFSSSQNVHKGIEFAVYFRRQSDLQDGVLQKFKLFQGFTLNDRN